MDLRNQFGAHVRSLRTARRITQDILAERSGLSVDSIRRIERGALSPTLDTIEKVANGLELTLSTLFRGFEDGASDSLEELGDLLSRKRPNEVRQALKVIRSLFD